MSTDHLLSPLVTAHCFWWPRCQHTVTDRPVATHDAMEHHYAQRHSADIARIITPRDGWLTRQDKP